MFVTYMRSSSYGAWDFCEHRYYLEYVLGIKGRSPNNKADKGSVVHKALELLAHRKVCEQNGTDTFTDPELGVSFRYARSLQPDDALDLAYAHYSDPRRNEFTWTKTDEKHCREWMWNTLDFNDGMFSPLNRKVITPEQYFDLPIDEPWARYCYTDPHTGEEFSGQLAIKGTIDLVTEAAPDTLEYLDWKTGRRWDWGNDKEKTYKALTRDPQLLLYFYALNRLYPQYRNIFVTIFFCQDGGPFSICFDQAHVRTFLDMLRRRFEAVRNTMRPKRIITDGSKNWKCSRLCSFGKDTQPPFEKKSVCEFMHDQVQALGLDRVTKHYGKPGAFRHYGSGGGQTNREGGEG